MVIMDALCIPFIFCIIMFELNYVICAHERSLRKLKQRIEMMEINNHKRMNDLELEVRSLRIELDEQRTRADALEAMINSTGADSRVMSGETHTHPIPGDTEIMTDFLDEQNQRIRQQIEISLQSQLQNVSEKQTLLEGQVTKLDKYMAETCVPVESMTQFSETLRKAFRAEKTLTRKFYEEIEQSVQTQNSELQNISNTLSASMKSMENDMVTLMTEKNLIFSMQTEENIKLLKGSVDNLQSDLNLLKFSQTLIQAVVDNNTVLLEDEQQGNRELKTDVTDAKRKLQNLEKMAEQVARFAHYEPNSGVDHFDCKDILEKGISTMDGVYLVTLRQTREIIPVYCDMTTDEGGWTVFQKRFDGSVDFYKNFHDYENGFGSISGEFWLGLKYIYQMTKDVNNELRIDLEKPTGEKGYALYQSFSISEPPYYKLYIGAYSGTAGDGGRGLSFNTGKAFSTYDKGNTYCGKLDHGGWWYWYCTYANLNGEYVTPGSSYRDEAGAFYYAFDGVKSLKSTEMKFRRKS